MLTTKSSLEIQNFYFPCCSGFCEFFRSKMCNNITVGLFELVCCSNGTFYPVLGIWSRFHAPGCPRAEVAEEEDSSGIILHVLLGVLLFLLLIARLLLLFLCGIGASATWPNHESESLIEF